MAVFARLVGAGGNAAQSGLMIRDLGAGHYGRLILVLSFLSLIPFADLGLGDAAVTKMSGADAAADETGVRGAAATLRRVSLLIGVLFLAVSVGLLVWGQGSTSLIDIRSAGALAAAVGVTLPANAYLRILIATQRSDYSNAFALAGSICSLAATAAAAAFGAPAYVLALTWYSQFTIQMYLSQFYVSRKLRHYTPRRADFVRASAAPMFRLGLGFLLLSVVGAIAFETDELVIGILKGAQTIALYDVHARFFVAMQGVIFLGLAPLWPAVSAAAHNSDRRWIERTCRTALVVSFVASALIASAVLALIHPIVSVLAGGRVAPSYPLGAAFAVWSVTLTVTGTSGLLLKGLGIIRTQILLSLLMLAVNIACTIPLTKALGASGPLWGTVIALGSCCLVPQLIILRNAISRLPDGRRSELDTID